MQPNNRSSFIPKKSIKRVERVRAGKQTYILSMVAYVIFFATLIGVVAVYFYANILNTELDEKIAELDAQRVAFSQSDIVRVKEAERKLKISEHFFSNHVSVYAVLKELERYVVDDVLFNAFSYKRSDEAYAEVDVSAGTEGFDSASFQNSIFNGASILDKVIVEGVSKSDLDNTVVGSQVVSVSEDQEDQLPLEFNLGQEVEISKIKFSLSTYGSQSFESSEPVTSVSADDEILETDSETEEVSAVEIDNFDEL